MFGFVTTCSIFESQITKESEYCGTESITRSSPNSLRKQSLTQSTPLNDLDIELVEVFLNCAGFQVFGAIYMSLFDPF